MICLPVIETDVKNALRTAEKYSKIADIIEFRLDMLKRVNTTDIEKFANYPCIITVRANWDGGFWNGKNEKRLDLIKKSIECNVKFVDIELREKRNKDIVRFRDEIGSRTKVIVSYHNFEDTPSKEELIKIVDDALSIGDIAKFATKVNKKEDILTILNIITRYSGKVIGIGMGEMGKLTRILGPYFGSVLTFASYGKKSSAPGQIDVFKLKRILKTLNDIYLKF